MAVDPRRFLSRYGEHPGSWLDVAVCQDPRVETRHGGEMLTKKEKVAYHIAKVEAEQSYIDKREAQALELFSNSQRPRYEAKRFLQDDFEYNRAVGNRNGHMNAANMYALAVIAGVD